MIEFYAICSTKSGIDGHETYFVHEYLGIHRSRRTAEYEMSLRIQQERQAGCDVIEMKVVPVQIEVVDDPIGPSIVLEPICH